MAVFRFGMKSQERGLREAQPQPQCPNPGCSGSRVSMSVLHTLADPGRSAIGTLLSRVGVREGRLANSLLLYVLAALSAPFWWSLLGWLAIPMYAVVALDAVAHLYMALAFARGAGRMAVATYKCSRCGYTWRESDAPQAVQVRRYEWEVERWRGSRSSNRKMLASLLSDLGGLLVRQESDLGRARSLIEESLSLRRELGNPPQTAYSLNNLAFSLFVLGQHERARPFAEEAVAAFRQQREWRGLAYALHTLGWIVLEGGDPKRARGLFSEALILQQRMANRESLAGNLEALAAVAGAQGQHLQAVRLASATATLRAATGTPLTRSFQARRDALLDAAHLKLTGAEFEEAQRSGASMSADEAVAYATGMRLDSVTGALRRGRRGETRWGVMHLALLGVHLVLLFGVAATLGFNPLKQPGAASGPMVVPTAPAARPVSADGHAATYSFQVYADSYQFYLTDEHADWGALSADFWSPDAYRSGLAVDSAAGIAAVGTQREDTLPVLVQVRDSAPGDDLSVWDRVAEGSVVFKSNKILISYLVDTPASQAIPLKAGTYKLRAYAGGLRTVTPDGLHGQDHYQVVLWPGQSGPTRLLKK